MGAQVKPEALGSEKTGTSSAVNVRLAAPAKPEGDMADSAKQLIKQALDKMPDDATVEEAMERILFLSKIEQGIAEADAGKTLSSEEVRKRLGL